MKRIIALSLLMTLFAALPAHAQIIRNPVVQEVIRSPFVHDLANFGLHQFFPGLPTLPSLPPVSMGNDSTILVDSAVRGNLDRAARNLGDTDDIMRGLLYKYKAAPEKAAEKKADVKTDDKKTASVTDLEQRFIDLAKRFEAQTLELDKLKKTPIGTDGIDLEAIRKLIEERAAADKKKAVNMVPISDEKSIAKKGSTPITVVLTDAAPETLTLKARAINIAALTGSGMIMKGDKSGTVTIMTDNVPDGIIEVTIDIAATATTKAASLTIKTKVQAP